MADGVAVASPRLAPAAAARAPRVSLTDDEAKIVISRLGSRLRIAGTAELVSDPSLFPDHATLEDMAYRAGQAFTRGQQAG